MDKACSSYGNVLIASQDELLELVDGYAYLLNKTRGDQAGALLNYQRWLSDALVALNRMRKTAADPEFTEKLIRERLERVLADIPCQLEALRRSGSVK